MRAWPGVLRRRESPAVGVGVPLPCRRHRGGRERTGGRRRGGMSSSVTLSSFPSCPFPPFCYLCFVPALPYHSLRIYPFNLSPKAFFLPAFIFFIHLIIPRPSPPTTTPLFSVVSTYVILNTPCPPFFMLCLSKNYMYVDSLKKKRNPFFLCLMGFDPSSVSRTPFCIVVVDHSPGCDPPRVAIVPF